MQTRAAQQFVGRYCVIARMGGHSEIRRLEEGKDVFETAREIIGCKYLDHVRVQRLAPDVAIEFLVNDEGYIQWGTDPSKVNPIGTFLYNQDLKSPHYILGDLVFCLGVDGTEGGAFTGMCEAMATKIAMANNSQVLPKAREIIKIPEALPAPEVKISSYATMDDVLKAIRGDKSVKPVSVEVISGCEKGEEAAS